jgi:hypothetical protein
MHSPSTVHSARLPPAWKEGSYHGPDPMAPRPVLPRLGAARTLTVPPSLLSRPDEIIQ